MVSDLFIKLDIRTYFYILNVNNTMRNYFWGEEGEE